MSAQFGSHLHTQVLVKTSIEKPRILKSRDTTFQVFDVPQLAQRQKQTALNLKKVQVLIRSQSQVAPVSPPLCRQGLQTKFCLL